MKKMLLIALLLVGCTHVDAEQTEQSKKIEAQMTEYINAGLSAGEKGFDLLVPYDPTGDKIDNLPDGKYSKALEKAWVNATIEHNFKKANKFLNKAQDIRTGQ